MRGDEVIKPNKIKIFFLVKLLSEEIPVITLTEKTYSTLCFAGTQRNDAGRIVRYADDGRRNVWNDAVWHGKGESNNKRNIVIHNSLVANRTCLSYLQFGEHLN